MSDTTTQVSEQEKKAGFFTKLYTGTGAFDIIGRRNRYYIATGIIIVIAILGILIPGFKLSIDFEGGTQVSFPVGSAQADTAKAREVVQSATGIAPSAVQTAGSGASQTYQISTSELSADQITKARAALFEQFQPPGRDGKPSANTISFSAVSSTWGGQITQRALLGLIVFLVLVTIYIAVRFRELEMALAALASLFFDVIVTAGVYAWSGFEVSPATVIGLLTILGFSLYDTVVVFDKVEENVRGVLHTNRRTYAEQANLAVNQTLMRSINTTVISALPIVALMVVAAWILGVGTLMDLGLVQLVGVVVGTYSSVFFASPLLVTLKERKPEYKAHTQKVLNKRRAVGVEAESAVVQTAQRLSRPPVRKRDRRRG
ncbi:Protein-export membrane protein SecF OS=Tsukamurella paurometabola (strain ATCC 8368 / DSM /CCUG 35730 / CIP 100753 / JCM 10117 / KCTC 9821 / NBRC 16120/ NCIMB 702349 / NCTC 13040) OX=521096 GN=secF PE=3 SV=1 [Tsukamurella paurometabola]|uniref:Protein-export membrane protein SecF n=1 Tax=Tsukamurella paurometabola (strain ATCC 8368 / DSM 20162 / CCUG 35730 / CIP 100753 / JCM 10117 / KCTC 9821 / NBRC 16120 / NCIMB 702349 / NCTC 13040) TaxID=521096 RepID=D5UNI8_TSUPD|nr:protein translocase subunit SecF [Tsukamurella paurometabola]ADG78556.1 protein-export membrane protein SecF [Tsukamurella paurometabola DSM 20162]SUP32168.1 preprotein translocase subunit SecF [Tsukamurella paurometabola]